MGSVTLCVSNLRSPDARQREDAARIIWERFAPRLLALVRRHLDNRIRRREDEQDVLQNVYTSFCLGQLEGKPKPASREELWKLLARITMCKVVNTANHHRAARRDIRRERFESHDSGSLFPQWMLEHVDKAQPSHEEKILILDEVERLIEVIVPELRPFVRLRLDGFTNAEIAEKVGLSVRSIELKMQAIRKQIEIGPNATDADGRDAPAD